MPPKFLFQKINLHRKALYPILSRKKWLSRPINKTVLTCIMVGIDKWEKCSLVSLDGNIEFTVLDGLPFQVLFLNTPLYSGEES